MEFSRKNLSLYYFKIAKIFFRETFLQHNAETVSILTNQKVKADLPKIRVIIKPYAFGIKAGALNQFRHRQSILILVI